MKIGFVICSRSNSKRVPRKCFTKIDGIPLIEHLILRALRCGYPVYLAVPGRDYEDYKYLKEEFKGFDFHIHMGQGEDPLKRTWAVAMKYELDAVIRVCHDKIFVDKEILETLLDAFKTDSNLQYAFSSECPSGASLEIIKTEVLREAAKKFTNVEHVSYAVRCVTTQIKNVPLPDYFKTKHRLLLDFKEDIKVLDAVLAGIQKKKHGTLREAIEFLDKNPWLSRENRPPLVTVYTCAHNAEKWIQQAMGSVAKQHDFSDMEYIIVDDHSTDRTPILVSKFCDTFKNTRWFRNEKNVGLASSSNIALTEARGEYIIRLDADDFFVTPDAIRKLIDSIEAQSVDIVYPHNYFGSHKKVQEGCDAHHVGGAIFRTRAANHVKFSEGLRGYEGLDFFVRAREQLKIGYYPHPLFFYRQHKDSLTKNNLEERQQLKEKILGIALH